MRIAGKTFVVRGSDRSVAMFHRSAIYLEHVNRGLIVRYIILRRKKKL